MSKEAYYAVARGKNVGIYSSWNMCKDQITGFANARFKKFPNMEEAVDFINKNKTGSKLATSQTTSSSLPQSFAKNTSQSSSSSPKGTRKRNYSATTTGDDGSGETEVKRVQLSQNRQCPVVYTDGACSSNGKKRAKAGWGVYWGVDDPRNSFGPVHGVATNNRGELLGVIEAIKKAKETNVPEIVIRTDSQLCINSCDTWIKKWEKNGWKSSTGDVKNKDLLIEVQNLRKHVQVHFEKVKAHCGELGNEAADELARKGAEMYKV